MFGESAGDDSLIFRVMRARMLVTISQALPALPVAHVADAADAMDVIGNWQLGNWGMARAWHQQQNP